MQKTKVRIGEGGRVVIPSEFRKAMGLSVGDELIVTLDEGELRMHTRLAGIRRAQEIVRQHIPADRSLVDELLAERRAEAARE